jgi:acyl-CoA synthetase (NDP forming)
LLARRRAEGLWTPVLAGPNGVGFLGCEGRLNATFISREKLPFEARNGPLALVSQSGAFLLACISKAPQLPLRYGVSIGNQLDLRLSDYLRALACDARIQVLACYVEGFRPGDLLEVVQIVKELKATGKRMLLYKGGRSEAGQAAASSHTGALAGDWALQREVLCRAGAILASSVAEFDAAMAWLGAYPQGSPCQVAVLTNAGYEAVTSADLVEKGLRGYVLEANEQEALSTCLAEHGLEDLVAPRVPLDLTPMAGERAFLDCTRLLAGSRADTVILGLVPFTQYLQTEDETAMNAFAQELTSIAEASGKLLAVAVDAGPEFEAYRRVLMQAGLPVFPSMERALLGLRLLAK